MSRAIHFLCASLGLALIPGAADFHLRAAEKTAKPNPLEAKALLEVKEALKAEASGDNQRRNVQLASAAKTAPELPDVNWHLANVQVGSHWMSLAAAQEHSASDPQMAEYRRLRLDAKGNPKLLRNLARWCTKAGWDDLSRLHYAQLLTTADADAELQHEALEDRKSVV